MPPVQIDVLSHGDNLFVKFQLLAQKILEPGIAHAVPCNCPRRKHNQCNQENLKELARNVREPARPNDLVQRCDNRLSCARML